MDKLKKFKYLFWFLFTLGFIGILVITFSQPYDQTNQEPASSWLLGFIATFFVGFAGTFLLPMMLSSASDFAYPVG
jgi:hypothetical protein